MRISDWSSDVCSSDLPASAPAPCPDRRRGRRRERGLRADPWGERGSRRWGRPLKPQAQGGGKGLVAAPPALYFRASGSGCALPRPPSRFHSAARIAPGPSLLACTARGVLDGVAGPLGWVLA